MLLEPVHLIKDDLLYRLNHPTQKKRRRQQLEMRLVIPHAIRKEILRAYHDQSTAGHLGRRCLAYRRVNTQTILLEWLV